MESEFGMHLREMAKHARAIALSGLLVGLALFAYQLTRPDEYRSTAAVRLVVDDQLADDGSITAFQTQSLAETALAADMLNAAAERAGITPDADSLRDRIDVEVRSTPGYLDVATTGPTAGYRRAGERHGGGPDRSSRARCQLGRHPIGIAGRSRRPG
ncbi:MAG: hypothetical protein R2710_30975 [Acidimicrobiales bacterium]